MLERIKILIPAIILKFNIIFCQFSSVDITVDDRLLRSNEKRELMNIKSDIKRFFLNTPWDENYMDLSINLYIQLVYEGVTQKGNETIYNCQALFSNGRDVRYFDKSFQFYYNSGNSLYYDPVLFEPLTGLLAFYAHLMIAGEIDTYEFKGGNESFEFARDIALRGSSSDYKKGWGKRISLVDDVNRNTGLRKARLAWYLALDLFKGGDLDSMIEELDTMLDGIEQSYIDVGRDSHTQYFLKTQSNKIAETFSLLGQDELLKDMKEIDSDRKDVYQSALDAISE